MFDKLADSHTHIFTADFACDQEEVIERASQAGIRMMVMPNIDCESIPNVLRLAKRYPEQLNYALGIHPEAIDDQFEQCLALCKTTIERQLTDIQFVAIGEIGLDYYWDDTYRTQQEKALRIQFEWAIEYDLPVILHTRKAHQEMVKAVSEYAPEGLRGVFHSFDGTDEELERLLLFENFFIGINGIVTFKKNEALRKTVKGIPNNRLLIETDAPYLSPHPLRGKRNEPAHLVHTLDAIASEKGMSSALLAEITYHNTERLFKKIIAEKHVKSKKKCRFASDC